MGHERVTTVHVNHPASAETREEQMEDGPGSRSYPDGMYVEMRSPGETYPNTTEVSLYAYSDRQGHLSPNVEGRAITREGADLLWSTGTTREHPLSETEASAAMADARQQLTAILSSAAGFVRRAADGAKLDGQDEVDVPGRTGVLQYFTPDRFELRREDDGTVKVYARATGDLSEDAGAGLKMRWVSVQCQLTTDASGAATCEAGANLYINDINGGTERHPSVHLWDIRDPGLLREIAAVAMAGSKD